MYIFDFILFQLYNPVPPRNPADHVCFLRVIHLMFLNVFSASHTRDSPFPASLDKTEITLKLILRSITTCPPIKSADPGLRSNQQLTLLLLQESEQTQTNKTFTGLRRDFIQTHKPDVIHRNTNKDLK